MYTWTWISSSICRGMIEVCNVTFVSASTHTHTHTHIKLKWDWSDLHGCSRLPSSDSKTYKYFILNEDGYWSPLLILGTTLMLPRGSTWNCRRNRESEPTLLLCHCQRAHLQVFCDPWYTHTPAHTSTSPSLSVPVPESTPAGMPPPSPSTSCHH